MSSSAPYITSIGTLGGVTTSSSSPFGALTITTSNGSSAAYFASASSTSNGSGATYLTSTNVISNGSGAIYFTPIPIYGENTLQLSTVAQANLVKLISAATTIEFSSISSQVGAEILATANNSIEFSSQTTSLAGQIHIASAMTNLTLKERSYHINKKAKARQSQLIKIRNLSNTIVTLDLNIRGQNKLLKIPPGRTTEVVRNTLNFEQIALLRNEFIISIR